jgi:hypothetical protein
MKPAAVVSTAGSLSPAGITKLRLQTFFERIRPYWWQFALLALQSGLIGGVYAVTDFTQALMAGPNRSNIWVESSYTVSTAFLISFGRGSL